MTTSLQRYYWPTNGWRTSTPEQQGMDSHVLSGLDHFLQDVQKRPALNTVLVVRHGYIVYERYFKEYHQQSYQQFHSMTKSVISTLIGIALQQGYLTSLDQHWEEFVPEYFTATSDPKKKQITLRHLLKMTSGLQPDPLAYPGRHGDTSQDWIHFAVEQANLASPEQMFMYCSLGSHMLSVILTRATGMSTLEFARKYLFAPLGIESNESDGFFWKTDPQGYYIGGAEIQLKARDAAKLGYLYLNNGQWDGTQLIPADYIHEATQEQTRGGSPETTGYGYHWWVTREQGYHSFFAAGFGGQYIQVFPELDTEIVIFAPDAFAVGEYHRKFIALLYILPAIQEIIGGELKH